MTRLLAATTRKVRLLTGDVGRGTVHVLVLHGDCRHRVGQEWRGAGSVVEREQEQRSVCRIMPIAARHVRLNFRFAFLVIFSRIAEFGCDFDFCRIKASGQ